MTNTLFNNQELITNKLVLAGTIVNKYETNKVIILTLGITQIINGKDGTPKKVSHYPKVYFFKSDNTGAEKFMLHDKVKITGHVSSSKRYTDSGEPYISQSNIGDKIEEQKTILEENFGNIKGGGYTQPLNIVYLNGNVKEIRKKASNVNQIIVEALNNGKYNAITVISFSDKAVRNINVGDTISVSASVATSKKEKNGKTYFYENVIANRIFKK